MGSKVLVAEASQSSDLGSGNVHALSNVDPSAGDPLARANTTFSDDKGIQKCPDLQLPCCSRAARVPEGPSSGNVAAVPGLSLCNPNDSPSCHLEPHARWTEDDIIARLEFSVGRSCDASEYHLLYWFLVFLALMHQQMLGLLVLAVDWRAAAGKVAGSFLLCCEEWSIPFVEAAGMQLLSESITLHMWSAVVGLPGSGSEEFVSLNLLLWFGAGLADASLLMHVVKCGAGRCVSYDLVSYIWLVLFDGAALQNQVMDDLAEFNMLHVSCCSAWLGHVTYDPRI
ncbi:hypothetical protein Nepgr_031342 [Nepenthes gracilis]|uniref:Uncharacterized protein n=1 Tax=Nepenthes gracilis TaxID=150966 RepID=A0AAD3THY0_NEPGR|nr:hypothetical protein Nepgr_031342 [Nepenthes gracilis]